MPRTVKLNDGALSSIDTIKRPGESYSACVIRVIQTMELARDMKNSVSAVDYDEVRNIVREELEKVA